MERVSQAIRNGAGHRNSTKGDSRLDNLQRRTRVSRMRDDDLGGLIDGQ